MGAGRFLTWTVSGEHSGKRVKNFLAEQFDGQYSGKEIKKAIERNALLINETQERHASRRLVVNDRVKFDLSIFQIKEPQKTGKFENQRVLYEDKSLLVYNKPAGITSVVGGLLSILRKEYPTLLNVHRLDKDTTGAIIFPKSDEVKELLIEDFREKSLEKRYLAVVDGVIEKDSGVIDRPIGKLYEKDGHTLWGIKSVRSGGMDAITEWRVIGRGDGVTLVECSLITGRTHQLRIHLSDMGYPIIGDIRYGKVFEGRYQPPHQLLHAWKLFFAHPVTGEAIHVKAPLPAVFQEAIKQLNIEGVDL